MENKAFEIVNKIQELINWQSISFLEIGKLLVQLREGKLYREYASHIRWMGDIAKELKISKSQLYNYERVYTMFGKKLEKMKLQIPLLRLLKIIPLIKKGENADEWLRKAAELHYEDFLDEIQIWKGGKSYLDCSHEETETYQRCTKCQKWITKEMPGAMGKDNKEEVSCVC